MECNEQDLQQLIQIREEIHKEIEKIPLNVLQLQEVSNRFVGHFKVFESLSQNIQDQLKSTIRSAAFEMAELASEEFIKHTEPQVHSILKNLHQYQCADDASLALESISRKNTLKTISICSLIALLSLSIGFSIGGYYYDKRSYELSKKFLRK